VKKKKEKEKKMQKNYGFREVGWVKRFNDPTPTESGWI
jgi:hypothetical protein